MSITARPYKREADLLLLQELVQTQLIMSRHVIDLAWQLSSPALYTSHDVCFWELELLSPSLKPNLLVYLHNKPIKQSDFV